ncbi:scavenger receptor cysteine-rich type 1 protein M160 [Clarias gariepinus]|uniref:scavenger receptor cysteine-rich type 1 protein M160 n=1 Tax=Clarias gariepinus TaxID=13013 RepID=UPI00234CB7E8|nr:scavenger receptor cysteine-rich type 1 protein M160 [Clarias gariepinus]
MWFLLLCIQLTAIQAQNRIALRGSSHPCEGHLEVYHNNIWGLVGHHQWSPKNGEVVCKSLGCGKHVGSGVFENKYKKHASVSHFWLDEINCTGTEDNLWNCASNGWGTTTCQSHNYISVICSGSSTLKPTLSLNLNGMSNECAGVVQFRTPNSKVGICYQTWDDAKGNKVCQELGCGKLQKTLMPITLNNTGSLYSVSLNCMDNEDFLWQCVDWVSAKEPCQEEVQIICHDYTPVRLHGGTDVCEGTLQKYINKSEWANESCQEFDHGKLDSMCAKLKCGRAVSVKPCNESKNTWLKCSDRVTVELREGEKRPTKCYGEIYVSRNSSHNAVCTNGTSSLEKVGKVVCQELKCGTPLSVLSGSEVEQGQISHVECDGQENSLWECKHQHGPVEKCQTITVICSDSLEMRLSNGQMDKCAGQLELKLKDEWQSVQTTPGFWPEENSKMVCQHLHCGNSVNKQHTFVKRNFKPMDWKLQCKTSSISECKLEQKKYDYTGSVINIICSDYKLWFLQGDSPCEGRVKGETGEYLQNITNEMAKEVCLRNRCGQGIVVPKIENNNMNSSVCHENTTSSSNCSMKNVIKSPDSQFVYVNCSEKKSSRKVWLQNKCYGKVLVCSDETCGVCADTWTEAQSGMLCKNLGCGQAIISNYKGEKKPGVTVASVHCSQSAENFSQCNFIELKDSLCTSAAYVACTGSVIADLQDPRDKCAGNIKLFYSGAYLPLCYNSIDTHTQDLICKTLGCGGAIENSFSKAIDSSYKKDGLTTVTCKDGNSNISSCDFSKTKVEQCQVGHLQCKDWKRLLLINPYSACEGAVFIQNQTDLYAVISDGWGNQEGKELCKYLECGELFNISGTAQVNTGVWSSSYHCTGNPKSIWDCEKESSPTTNNQLSISCTNKDKSQLSFTSIEDNNCTGEVKLKNDPVCYKSQNTGHVFNELCQQRGCSTSFRTFPTTYKGKARYVSCTGKESNLQQCNSWTNECTDGGVMLACTMAFKWNFSSTCGGKLQVNYRGKLEFVQPLENMTDANRICNELKCGNASTNKFGNIKNKTTIDIKIKCDKNQNYVKHCVKFEPRETRTIAVIYCDEYNLPVEISAPETGLIVGIVVGLVLVLVAALVVFWKRKAFLTILSFKFSDENPDVELSENEMQSLKEKDMFKVEDYDNVVTSENQMEDNQSKVSGFEHDEENMRTSKDSSGTEYDDVDEKHVKPEDSSPTEPSLPPRPDNLLDEVTFEAEVESQEDYDDVLSLQTVDSEQRDGFSVPGPSSALLVSNDEAQSQEDE